ncbi:MAG: YeeE/YedE family protein [Flavobacteriales bacterium]|nr:YeeE/YedE family protein [Flavobacteriales bacterium]
MSNIEMIPWYIAGPAIAIIMLSLKYLNKSFGISSTLDHICTLAGSGRVFKSFRQDLAKHKWKIFFVIGVIGGGYLGNLVHEINSESISRDTLSELPEVFQGDVNQMIPEFFNDFSSLKVLSILILGGVLIGFGTRFAGGCTSGHSITGMSALQLASLIATIGFFSGGLIMTHILFPYIF